MRQRPWLIAAIVGTVLLSPVARVAADTSMVLPAALVPALNVYVDALVAGHATAIVCGTPDSPSRDEKAWSEAKAALVAMLWVNGFPAEFARQTARKLDAPVADAKPACPNEGVVGYSILPQAEGWPGEVKRLASSLNLTFVSHPVPPEQWLAIKSAIAGELPAAARLFDCVAVSMPGLLVLVVHDWDEMLAKIGQKLAAAGLPRDEISAVLSAAEANTLWHRVSPEAEPALIAACAKDNTWQDRFFQFQYLSPGALVEKLLPSPESEN